MISLVVLFFSWLVFALLGFAGVPLFADPHDCVRYALVAMFLFTASSHFTRMKEDFIRMIPPFFRYPRELVWLTGVLEIAGALGLLLPMTRGVAALCLVLLLVAMFPANVYAALRNVPLRGRAPTPLWLRVPMQVLYIALLLWIAF